SNPYIEHGRGNARTNCIGCHQHGGSTVGQDLDADGTLDPFDLELVIDNEGLFPLNGRQQIRSLFPADYLWSIHRVDNLAQVLKSEVANFDNSDLKLLEFRIQDIQGFIGDPEEGGATFGFNCTTCHGDDGTGTAQAPSLYERAPKLTDTGLLTILIQGKGNMPSWGHFTDEQLADLRSYVRATFDP
ncbi:MAG: cytochrome c, partial [Myxococcota bacterium]|nr:cytochrome c [Myxococcota bacterium]